MKVYAIQQIGYYNCEDLDRDGGEDNSAFVSK